MASNNLRIIYQNIIDMTGTTISASTTSNSTTTPISNTQSDLKSKVWRTTTSSSTAVYGTILVTNTTAIAISGIILAFSNLSSSATIRVRGWSGSPPTIGNTVNSQPSISASSGALFDTGTVIAAPYQGLGEWNWGSNPNSSIGYTNTRVYARLWLSDINTSVACTSWTIEVYDPTSTDQFLEISRIILGSSWSPKYNTSFGLSNTIKDMSTNTRSEAGDLITFAAPYYNTLTFDLQYMDKTDRSTLFKIIRSIGTRKAIFVSLFPDNSADWSKEQIYQIYGKLVQIPGLAHSTFETYASQIDIEEI